MVLKYLFSFCSVTWFPWVWYSTRKQCLLSGLEGAECFLLISVGKAKSRAGKMHLSHCLLVFNWCSASKSSDSGKPFRTWWTWAEDSRKRNCSIHLREESRAACAPAQWCCRARGCWCHTWTCVHEELLSPPHWSPGSGGTSRVVLLGFGGLVAFSVVWAFRLCLLSLPVKKGLK